MAAEIALICSTLIYMVITTSFAGLARALRSFVVPRLGTRVAAVSSTNTQTLYLGMNSIGTESPYLSYQ